MRKSKEQWWIERKLKSGVTREQLLHSVGSFSNKTKKRVMKEKNLSEKQYRERYDFLSKVYVLLSDAPAQKSQSVKRSYHFGNVAKTKRPSWPEMDAAEEDFKRAGAALSGIEKDPSGYLRDRSSVPVSSSKPKFDYSEYFDFDKKGRIKGGYTPDGRFEPD